MTIERRSDVVDHNRRALARQQFCHTSTDASSGTGYDCDPTFESFAVDRLGYRRRGCLRTGVNFSKGTATCDALRPLKQYHGCQSVELVKLPVTGRIRGVDRVDSTRQRQMRDIAAIDEKYLTVDLRRAVGCEIGNEGCHVAWLPRQFVGLGQRTTFHHHLLNVARDRCNHPRLGSRRDAVGSDAVFAQILGQHFGEASDAALRRAVIGLSDGTYES